MGCGILESRGPLEHVPGTSQLNDVLPVNTTHLKKGTGRNAGIFLIPQPSNDPNDPLNWPLWQRDLLLVLFSFCTLTCVGGVGPILAVITFPVLLEFKLTFTQLSLLTGYQECLIGGISIFVSAACVKYGKRAPFLLSLVFLIAGGAVCGGAQSYNGILGGRLLQGVGTTAFEGVTFSLVGDMYYVHERGARFGFFIVSQSGLLLLPSLIAGQIGESMGWRWVFWFLTIVTAIAAIGIFLFGWETAYNRNSIYNIDTSSHDNLQIIEQLKSGDIHEEEVIGYQLDRAMTASSTASRSRDSIFKRMKPWTGQTYTEEPLTKLIIRPLYTMFNPAVFWCVIIIAFSQLWNVVINLLVAQLFAVPPYSLTTAQIGYIFVGPIISGLLGCALCGLTSDPISRFLAKRNGGVFEPEFRLAIMALNPLFCALGYFLFGKLITEEANIVVISVVWGLAFVSVQICSNAAGSYLVDAYREISVECFVISMVIKSFVFFGFSFILNDWVMVWGPLRTFNTIAGIMLGFSATTIPVYMYGKRVRAWWHVHNLLASKP